MTCPCCLVCLEEYTSVPRRVEVQEPVGRLSIKECLFMPFSQQHGEQSSSMAGRIAKVIHGTVVARQETLCYVESSPQMFVESAKASPRPDGPEL